MNRELGLDWLTFRYRNYMPEVGRFFGVDPVSGEYMSISTYQFAHNSPIWKIELEGLEGGTTTDSSGQGDIGNHEPVKVYLGPVIGGDATRELARKAGGKVVQEGAKQTALRKVAGSVLKGAGVVLALLSDYASPNFGGNTNEGDWIRKNRIVHYPPLTEEEQKIIDEILNNPSKNIDKEIRPENFEQKAEGEDEGPIDRVVDGKREGSSNNEKHGDGGRAKTKAEKQIEALEKQMEGANKKNRKKLSDKIRRIRQDAQRKAKGEEHSRTKKT